MFNHKALPQSEDFQTARSYWISGVAPVLAKKPRWQPLAQRLSTWKKRTLQRTPQDVCESLAKVKNSGETSTWSCCLVKAPPSILAGSPFPRAFKWFIISSCCIISQQILGHWDKAGLHLSASSKTTISSTSMCTWVAQISLPKKHEKTA